MQQNNNQNISVSEGVDSVNTGSVSTDLHVRKSNLFVTSRFKMNLLEQKVVAISLTKLEKDGNQMKAVLYPTEIRKLMGGEKDSNLYKKLKSLGEQLTGHTISIEDGNGNFQIFSIITNATYRDGHLEIHFNKDMSPHIATLKKNYTTYELATLVSFDRIYSYRLYEILKKDVVKIDSSPTGYVCVAYSVNELRAMLGLINTDAPYISDAVHKGLSWDEIIETIAKKGDLQFEKFSDFRKRVLEPAQEEIADKTEIRFSFRVERNGHTRKNTHILFTIYANNKEGSSDKVRNNIHRVAIINKDQARQDVEARIREEKAKHEDILAYLRESGISIKEPFALDDFRSLYRLSGKSMAVIKAEIDYGVESYSGDDFLGWLKEAVKDRYSQAIEQVSAKQPQKRSERAEVNRKLRQTRKPAGLKDDAWQRMKAKEEYSEFIRYIGIDEETFEIAYDVDERIHKFTEFIKEMQ